MFCLVTVKSLPYIVLEPVAFFPLNGTYGTKEINGQVTAGDARKVRLASGPDSKANGSYEFEGSSNSYITFQNSDGGPLDVRYSMTILCWLYYGGRDGPLFHYNEPV